MMGGRLPAGFDDVGQKVASFPSYDAAQKAVSQLIAGEIPAKQIAIVGIGLRSIERITGKLGYATAARSGAINGLLLGLLFSAIFVIGTPSPPIQLFVGVLVVGIAIGMLLSLITFAIVRRRRDYASVVQVVADHYEITVAAASIHRAREILGAKPAETPATPRVDEWSDPPRYGERITPGGAAPATPVAPSGPARDPEAQGDAVETPEGIEVGPEPAPTGAPAPESSEPQGDAVPTEDGIVVGPEDPTTPGISRA